MLSIETTRSLPLSCWTLLLARMNIIAALEGTAAAGIAVGELPGAVADIEFQTWQEDVAGQVEG